MHIPAIKNSIITPHDWQARTLSKVNSNIAEGNTRILVSAPTGAGKAFMAMFIIQMLLSQGKRVLLLVDRIKLVTQLCESADKFGFDYNVVSGAIKQFDNSKLLTIGTIQTFYKLDTPRTLIVLLLTNATPSTAALSIICKILTLSLLAVLLHLQPKDYADITQC